MKESRGRAPTLRDSLIAGCVSGMAAISCCHPFDVIRTKMQVTTSNDRSFSHILGILRGSSFISLYQGFALPFFAQGLYKSVIFSTNLVAKKLLFGNNSNASSEIAAFVSGTIAGSVNALFVSPIELIRTRQILSSSTQSVQLGDTGTRLKGGIYSVVTQLQKEAGLLGFWRCYFPTALRDGPGIGLYLLAFEQSKHWLTGVALRKQQSQPPEHGRSADSRMETDLRADSSPEQLSGERLMAIRVLSGSVAGVTFWVWGLPVDTIKTVIESRAAQTHHSANTAAPVGATTGASASLSGLSIQTFWRTGWQLMAEQRGDTAGIRGGLRRLYHAWPIALTRGVPSAAVTLTVYDYAIEYLTADNRFRAATHTST